MSSVSLVAPSSSSPSLRVAKTLDGRLLCAAECAYEIARPYRQGAGYLSGTYMQRLSKGINSCLIGRTIDGIVLAFRGTQGASPLDWLQNASVSLTNNPIGAGKIHAGFYKAIQNLSKDIKKALLQFLRDEQEDKNKRRKPKIYLTGHSKGGCLASLYALEMMTDTDLPNPDHVFSFGAARTGDGNFAEYFNKTVRQTSYENYLDIIPFLPPGDRIMADMDEKMKRDIENILLPKDKGKMQLKNARTYAPIGKRKYLDDKGKVIHHITNDLDFCRIQEIEKKTILKASEFRKAHCCACPSNHNCGGGYFLALAPEICS